MKVLEQNFTSLDVGDTVAVINNYQTRHINYKGLTGQVAGYSSLFDNFIYVILSTGNKVMFGKGELFRIEL